MATKFPNNSRFQVDYAKRCFDQWEATELTCQAVMAKKRQGYEALAGRAPAYLLGYL